MGTDGFLPEPNTPDDVVMYDFAGFYGLGGTPGSGNAVVAGDLNSWDFVCQDGTQAPPCDGVFWFLDELSAGDAISIEWEGRPYEYVVENLCWIDREENFESLVRTTSDSTLTMITAAGEFLYAANMFSHRLVVRASVTGATHSLSCGAGSSVALPKERFTDSIDDVYAIKVSPLIRGEEAVVFATAELGAVCYVEMRHADGTPVFYVPAVPVGGGTVGLQWRVWERLEVGSYDISVDCGAAPVTVRVTVADGPTRQF